MTKDDRRNLALGNLTQLLDYLRDQHDLVLPRLGFELTNSNGNNLMVMPDTTGRTIARRVISQ